jgi:hypothetical protein
MRVIELSNDAVFAAMSKSTLNNAVKLPSLVVGVAGHGTPILLAQALELVLCLASCLLVMSGLRRLPGGLSSGCA